MQQFSHFFESSDTEEITQKELFALFKKFTGYADLTQLKFVWKFMPQNYWTKKVKRTHLGQGRRGEQVVYKMRRKNINDKAMPLVLQPSAPQPPLLPIQPLAPQPPLLPIQPLSPFQACDNAHSSVAYPHRFGLSHVFLPTLLKRPRRTLYWNKHTYRYIAVGATIAFISVSSVLLFGVLRLTLTSCISNCAKKVLAVLDK